MGLLGSMIILGITIEKLKIGQCEFSKASAGLPSIVQVRGQQMSRHLIRHHILAVAQVTGEQEKVAVRPPYRGAWVRKPFLGCEGGQGNIGLFLVKSLGKIIPFWCIRHFILDVKAVKD